MNVAEEYFWYEEQLCTYRMLPKTGVNINFWKSVKSEHTSPFGRWSIVIPYMKNSPTLLHKPKNVSSNIILEVYSKCRVGGSSAHHQQDW